MQKPTQFKQSIINGNTHIEDWWLRVESIEGGDEKRLLMVFPLDMAAHYLRSLELCKKLKDQFQIVFAYSPTYEKFINKYGFETFEVENFDSGEVRTSASRFDFSWLSLPNVERVVDSQIKAIEENSPGLVLGDAAFTLKMAAEKTGVPHVSLLNGYMTMYYSVTRKVSPSHFAYPYSKKMPARVFDGLTRRIEHLMFKRIHAPFRSARRKLKLRKRSYFLQELEGDFNLICDLPSFFPQKKLPANYQFVGPLFYHGDEEEKEILDFLGSHHPNILVSTGSTGKSENLSILRDPVFKDFRIVITGNGYDTIHGENILSSPFVNNLNIMNKIDILICHGGNGTIYQALSHGVPPLCFPANFEQEWNVQRVTEMELGARLDSSFNASDIRKIVDTWIKRRSTHIFGEIQESIKAFVDKPIILNIDQGEGIAQSMKQEKSLSPP